MARILLEEPRQSGTPVVKRHAIGTQFNGAIINYQSRDRLKPDGNGNMVPIPKTNGKGNSQELVVTCIVMPGTTTPAGLGDNESIPEPGDTVRLILKSKAYGDWIDALKTLPGGGVAAGDHITQTLTVAQIYDATGKAVGGEIHDQTKVEDAKKRGKSVGIYGPTTLAVGDDDDEWTKKARAANDEMKRQQHIIETETAAAPFDTDSDLPPF